MWPSQQNYIPFVAFKNNNDVGHVISIAKVDVYRISDDYVANSKIVEAL